jgi:hypothetical protein
VLFQSDGRIVNVPPGYKYVIEEKEGGRDGHRDEESPVGQSASGA